MRWRAWKDVIRSTVHARIVIVERALAIQNANGTRRSRDQVIRGQAPKRCRVKWA